MFTPTEAYEYLPEIGKLYFSAATLPGGLRIGQAWFNALSDADQEKLRGTDVDPFYADDWSAVATALMFLMEA